MRTAEQIKDDPIYWAIVNYMHEQAASTETHYVLANKFSEAIDNFKDLDNPDHLMHVDMLLETLKKAEATGDFSMLITEDGNTALSYAVVLMSLLHAIT